MSTSNNSNSNNNISKITVNLISAGRRMQVICRIGSTTTTTDCCLAGCVGGELAVSKVDSSLPTELKLAKNRKTFKLCNYYY